ncbi:hypothetical protein FQZ97_1062630 [compost metagenome]
MPSSDRLTRFGASKSRAASSDTEPPCSALRARLTSMASSSAASRLELALRVVKATSAVLPAARSALTTKISLVLRCTPGSIRTRTRVSLSAVTPDRLRATDVGNSSKRCQSVLNSPVCGRSSTTRKPLSSKN